ncbi:hypothetical protein F5887DRAFT_1076120 [Amanita rubescens]|nr:hypothetical protein F5887DRAFT_1076120 [Amanita rubescens]
MSHQFPPEVAAIIIDYVADDFETLKNVSLSCHDFCLFAQSHLFSTIILNGYAQHARLTVFEELLQSRPRGATLASYIKNLSLLFCDDWFADEPDDTGSLPEVDTDMEAEVNLECRHTSEGVEEGKVEEDEEIEERPDSFCAIAFISEHAKGLRSIHLGPFTDMRLDWHETSQQVRDALTCLLKRAQEIVLEGVANMPLTLFREFHNLKSLDVSGFISFSGILPTAGRVPSLTSLAMHTGSNGTRWDTMSGLLQVIQRRQLLDLSCLTTLYLQLLDSPGRNALINGTLSSCADTLQDLRLYIWRDMYGRDVISLAGLNYLRSLYLVVNLPNIQESLLYLARTVETISVPETRLEELMLFLDVEDRDHNWLDDMVSAISATTPTPGSWNTTLNAKLSLLYKKRDDTRVTLMLPWPWVETGFNRVVLKFFRDAFPIVTAGNIADGLFKIEGFKSKGKLIKLFIPRIERIADALDAGFSGSSLTFRGEEGFLAVINGLVSPPPSWFNATSHPDGLVPTDETVT